jgi:PTS system glucose-specific IIA component
MALFHKLVTADALPSFKKALPILSPLSGKVLTLDAVPNKLFSERLFGEGVAIDPSGYQVFAPFAGTVQHLPATACVLRIKASNGLILQIQLGIEPQKMMGEGFKRKVKVGESFVQGQVLLEFDLAKMKAQLISVLSPVTVLNSENVRGIEAHCYQVIGGEDKALTVYV